MIVLAFGGDAIDLGVGQTTLADGVTYLQGLIVAAIGGGDAAWGDFHAYVIGPLVGGVLAALAYDAIARPRAAEDLGEPPQGTHGDIKGRRVEERRFTPT